jgi:hypothetical protein
MIMEKPMTTGILSPRLYIAAVIAAGIGLLLYLAPTHLENPVVTGGLFVSTLVVSVFKLRLPLVKGVSTMSMAAAIDFVALLLESANVAMLLGAIGVLMQCTVRVRRKQPIHRAAFSAAAVIIAVQVAGWGWRALGGNLTELAVTTTVLPLMVCAITYFAVNAGLVAAAVAVTAGSPVRVLSPEFLRSAPAYLVSAVVAALVALAIMHGVVILLPVVASPLYVCYYAYHKRWTEAFAKLGEEQNTGAPASV